jgi:hypothetical protein
MATTHTPTCTEHTYFGRALRVYWYDADWSIFFGPAWLPGVEIWRGPWRTGDAQDVGHWGPVDIPPAAVDAVAELPGRIGAELRRWLRAVDRAHPYHRAWERNANVGDARRSVFGRGGKRRAASRVARFCAA